MKRFISAWKAGVELDRLIYPKNAYFLSWVLLALGGGAALIGSLFGREGLPLMVIGLVVFYLLILLDDMYARRYIRKNIIEKKGN